MTTKLRLIVIAVLSIAVAAAIAGYLSFWNIRYSSDPKGQVVLVINTTAQPGFSAQVKAGVERAAASLDNKPGVEIVDIAIPAGRETDIFAAIRTFYSLTRALSRHRVLGYIRHNLPH